MATVAATHPTAPLVHGALQFPGATVDGYALEIRDAAGRLVGERASDAGFRAIIERLGGGRLGAREMAALLDDPSPAAARLLDRAIAEFARVLADVIAAFGTHRAWRDLDGIVIGGALGAGRLGKRLIARLTAERADLPPLRPLGRPGDEATLIGSAHLPPRAVLAGAEGMLALEIAGSEIRAGLVLPRLDLSPDLAAAEVSGKEVWRPGEQARSREAMVDAAAALLQRQIEAARRAGLPLAAAIGVACPGTIDAAGRIRRGGEMLPGDWQDPRFNLPLRLADALPPFAKDEPFSIIMHNDAVVAGLSELPLMADCARWAILTIGGGLGNACFTNH